MTLQFQTLQDVSVKDMRVLIREDFNVPVARGVVQSDLRIRAAIPGIKQILKDAAQVILMSHLGRPEPGILQPAFSLQPVAERLQYLLEFPVTFIKEWPPKSIKPSDGLVLLENVRFLPGEIENDPRLAKTMADLCDIFVLDAFGSAHRAHASTVGVIEFAPKAVAGPLLTSEVTSLDRGMKNPKHPVVAIIGGAKISSKLEVLQSLTSIVDVLIIGGGMANTFLAAQHKTIGASLYEADLLASARDLLIRSEQQGCTILLPTDCVTQNDEHKSLDAVRAMDKIVDIGVATRKLFAEQISKAATILWNGPMGVFEDPRFAQGTKDVAKAIANSKAYSIVGGGDTLAAIEKINLTSKFSYISTGGGAFLEYIEGKSLPAIAALINKSKK